jgi:uncharacterized protein with PIN domain
VVVDSSAVLAVVFRGEHAEWATAALDAHRGALCMSTVNLTEVLIHLRDRQPAAADAIERRLLDQGVRFVAPDVTQAHIAAAARLRYPWTSAIASPTRSQWSKVAASWRSTATSAPSTAQCCCRPSS